LIKNINNKNTMEYATSYQLIDTKAIDSQPVRTFSPEVSEDAIKMIMFEDDAEILERGVEDSSEPATPYETPRTESMSMLSPPVMDLGDSHADVDTDINRNHIYSAVHPSQDPLPQHTADGEANGVLSDNFVYIPSCIVKDSPTFIPNNKEDLSRVSERLETTLRLSQHETDEELTRDSMFREDSSTDVTSPISSIVNTMTESKSYHRRLQEAAQFAEAIGEPQDGRIQVIIDDDDYDESDDDEEDGNEEKLEASIASPEICQEVEHGESDSHVLDSNFCNAQETKIYSADLNASFVSDHHLDLEENRDESNNMNDSLPFFFVNNVAHNKSANYTYHQSHSHNNRDRFPSERSLSESNLDSLNKQEVEQLGTISGKPTHLLRRSASYHFFRHKLPLEDCVSEQNDDNVIKGIVSPEVTKRGISRGNYAQLHRKAWLEVSDKFHRYGKNLRTYYKHWEKLGHPTNMFFDWLDGKGEAAGWELPNLSECPREQLDNDRVLYITEAEEQSKYLLKIVPQDLSCDEDEHGNGGVPSKIVDVDGNPVRTGSNGWIFVLRDHELYGSEKRTRPKGGGGVGGGENSGNSKLRFHHSSFFGGKAVAAAGIIITDGNGCLTRLYPHSGHYRPGEAHMQRMLYHLYQCGVDLNSFLVDTQQIMHVSREVRDALTPKGEPTCDNVPVENAPTPDGNTPTASAPKKARKTDSLHLKDATFVALFLAHKARCIGKGLFGMIHKIRPLRRVEPCSVTTILEAVDRGGVWKYPTNKKQRFSICDINESN
jgi:hypothetical protein